ncbi:MAG: hypothetical protein ABIW79_00195 [Gemmatimonas sp.]
MLATRSSTAIANALDDAANHDVRSPLDTADSLGHTAAETCRQHERLSRLMSMGVAQPELEAAHALVDTCDLALGECVREFETVCAKTPASDDATLRQAANALWLAAREYLRRHSIAEKASRQLQHHDAEKLGDLHFEFELEASALLALRQAACTYSKERPEAK